MKRNSKNIKPSSSKPAPKAPPKGKKVSPEAAAFLADPTNPSLLEALEKEDLDLKELTTKTLVAFIEHHQPSALEDKNKDRETIVIIVADLLLELKTPAKEKPLTKAKKNSLGHKDPLTGPGKGRPRSNGDSIIVKVSKENPRKEGTHGWNSWNLLKPKITVDEYIAAGGRGNDLRWDIDKGHCVLDETPELFKK